MSTDTVSQRIGLHLLMGWSMLANVCQKCKKVPLMRNKAGFEVCVACDQPEPPTQDPSAAAEQAQRKTFNTGNSTNNMNPTGSNHRHHQPSLTNDDSHPEDFISISTEPELQVNESAVTSISSKKKKSRKKKKPDQLVGPSLPPNEDNKKGTRYFEASDNNHHLGRETLQATIVIAKEKEKEKPRETEKERVKTRREVKATTTTAAKNNNEHAEKKVHFAENVPENSFAPTQTFECKQLKVNVLASFISGILKTAESSLSSHDMADHYRVAKCLTLQLNGLGLIRSHLSGEKAIIDLSDLYRALLVRLEKIATIQQNTVEIAKLQFKTTEKLCKLLSRISTF